VIGALQTSNQEIGVPSISTPGAYVDLGIQARTI
jgi:hypothetical protein